jgi:transposase-like protein
MRAPPKAEARAARNRPDWRRAAQMLARGDAVTAVAAKLGCSRSQLSRKRNHEPLFQSWIAEFQQVELGPDARMARLRHAVHRAIENEVRSGNVRVVLWLADRLKLVTPPSEGTPGQELQDILNGLSPEELREFQDLGDPT